MQKLAAVGNAASAVENIFSINYRSPPLAKISLGRFFFSMWFGSRTTHLLRGLPTLSHLNWVLISSNRHVSCFDEWWTLWFYFYSLSLISFNLYQLTFIILSHLNPSFLTLPVPAVWVSSLAKHRSVEQRMMGNMKGLTFNWQRVKKTSTTLWHKYWAGPYNVQWRLQNVLQESMNKMWLLQEDNQMFMIGVLTPQNTQSIAAFCSQTCLYNNRWCIIFYTISVCNIHIEVSNDDINTFIQQGLNTIKLIKSDI